MQWYAAGLALAVVGLGAAVAELAPGVEMAPWLIAILAAVGFLAERESVFITPNTQMSVSALPVVFAAVVGGPYAGMIVAAATLLTDFGHPYTRWMIWTSTRVLVAGASGLGASAVLTADASLGRILLAVGVAGAIEAVGDIGLNSLTVALRRSGTFSATARAMSRLILSTLPLYAPVVGVLAYSYRELSEWTILLFFVPAFAAHRLLIKYQEQGRLVLDLAAANSRLEQANLSFATALVAALDARDEYTAGHSAAVAIYARDIARRLGMSDGDQQLAHVCGLVHDIGKVGLPAGLLEKPGPLTLGERRRMEEHSTIGQRILAKVDGYGEIARIVRHHHERVDGQGYPDGLLDEDIPLLSKIIAVADAYNAMTSDRPYREAMPTRVARLRLAQAAETQFDTAVVAAFEAILAGAPASYQAGVSANFAIEAQRHSALVAEPLGNVA